MMSGARQPSPWLKPYKIANSHRVLKLGRRPSNCVHFATRLRFIVSTPPRAYVRPRTRVELADEIAGPSSASIRHQKCTARLNACAGGPYTRGPQSASGLYTETSRVGGSQPSYRLRCSAPARVAGAGISRRRHRTLAQPRSEERGSAMQRSWLLDRWNLKKAAEVV